MPVAQILRLLCNTVSAIAGVMDLPGFETFLSHFAIKRSFRNDGKPNWTIDLVTNKDHTSTRLARFDEELGTWKLQDFSDNEVSSKLATKTKVTGCYEPTHSPSRTHWENRLPASPHTKALLELDWGSTSLGQLQTWHRSLQLYTQMLFSDPRPAAVYWGPQRITLYNEAAIPIMGAFHPTLLGRPLEEVVPMQWHLLTPIFRALEDKTYGFAKHGLELPTRRRGFLEESWWDINLIALKGDDRDHSGTYSSWTEVTQTILRDRRKSIIDDLGHSSLSSIHSFWHRVHDVFQQYPRDIPMAIMYSVDENVASNGQLHLEQSIGFDSHPGLPGKLNLTKTEEDAAIASLLRRAGNVTADLLIIDLSKEMLNPETIQDIDWQGVGEPSQHLAIIPLKDSMSYRGFILLGLNPRSNLDEDHRQFVTEIARQLNEIVTRATFQQVSRAREKILSTELSESEKRVSHMAQIVPVGIFELAADGALHWANNQFYEIMGVPQGQYQRESFPWTDYVHSDDHERAHESLGRCLEHGDDISDTVRLTKNWQPPGVTPGEQSATEPFWIMYSAALNLNIDGSTSSLIGSVTDKSQLKWAEKLQLRIAEAAEQERRIQEEFIDITSHEIRNPLSAITQSADGILLSLQEARLLESVESLKHIVSLNAEAAESILFCVAHQKRIIDDVLTLGKLDSKLLTVSPVVFRLEGLLNQAMQMFKAEFDANKIQIDTVVNVAPIDAKEATTATLTFHGDPSRLLQILVNLITNAIKFTKTQAKRNITVHCGSSYSCPSTQFFGEDFQWHCTGLSRPDLTLDPAYGDGRPVYLHFAVTDTGEGIRPDALGRIFSKFEQADRRTHTKYGGSGIGLYVSREMTELQGGCIGIESAVGVGSTFAFYTKGRLSKIHNTQAGHEPTPSLSTAAIPVLPGPLDPSKDCATDASEPQHKYNMLVVEDNVLNQTVLVKQLQRAGCNVQTSSHGGEAVDSILRRHAQPTQYNTKPSDNALPYFDCILMDWEMPVCDGIQATKQIRLIEQQQGATRTPIIGITANARAEQIEKAIDAGMDDVMPKPFRVAELLAKITGLIGPSGTDVS